MSKELALTNRYHELLSANNMTQNVKHFEGLYAEIAVSKDGHIAIYQPYSPENSIYPSWNFMKRVDLPEQQERLDILHISQINDIDIDVDGTEVTKVSGGLGGALVGGLFGGTLGAVIGSAATSGKVKSNTTYHTITLIIHTKDFNNPRIEIPLYHSPKIYEKDAVMDGNLVCIYIRAFPSGLRKYAKYIPWRFGYGLDKEGKRLYKEVYNGGQPNFTVIDELHSTLLQLLNAQQQSETAAASAPQLSTADELAKFKGLLDSGVITQEEFDAAKRRLLGL